MLEGKNAMKRRDFLKFGAISPLFVPKTAEIESSEPVSAPEPTPLHRPKNLLEFCQHYWPERFTMPFTSQQARLMDCLDRTVRGRSTSSRFSGDRGIGKTTDSIAALLFALLAGHKRFALYVTHSREQAQFINMEICDELERNSRLWELYSPLNDLMQPICGGPDFARRRGEQYAGEQRLRQRGILPGDRFFECQSINGQFRGLKRMLSDRKECIRPDLVIVDDPFSDDSWNSLALRERTRRQIGMLKFIGGVNQPASMQVIYGRDLPG